MCGCSWTKKVRSPSFIECGESVEVIKTDSKFAVITARINNLVVGLV